MASALGWGIHRQVLGPPNEVQPFLTLYTNADLPEEVVLDIFERHGDHIISVATFNGVASIKYLSFSAYLFYEGYLVVLGIILFLMIRRLTTKVVESEQAGATRPTFCKKSEPEDGEYPQPESEGRHR